MKKILVLGAAGMAGHVVYTYLTELNKYEVIGTTNSNNIKGVNIKLNIFDKDEVEKTIKKLQPDIIVNCIGMLIRTSRTNPDQTIYGNAYFPYILKDLADKNNAKLIHISTDCVFSGKIGGYTENSFKDATDVYGLSKNLGEIIDDKNLTIRTSIIGPELKQNGEGLFHWFMQQDRIVNGFKSNFWSGVTTLELAK
uniref:sugar nucleotide-binding protein n=1 Tax=Empedobacter sp. TaxID=1927715 RepID=UPI0028AB8762